MKHIVRITFVSALMQIALSVSAQTIDPKYEVATWHGFADAAITYTFDDNTANQTMIAIPMFNEYHFNATFFVVVDWNPDWAGFQEAVHAGHEIGSHTMSHPSLGELNDSLQNVELGESQAIINKKITGQNCQTMAYPYCVPSIDSITKKYYLAARHCQGYTEKSTPDDFYTISSIICGDQGSIVTLEDFKNKAEEAAASKGWNVYLLHGIEKDDGYSPVTSEVLRQSLKFLDDHRDKYWVATFLNAVLYIKERNAVSVQELEVMQDTIRVRISDTLPDSIFAVPVTIRRTVPENWNSAKAVQGDKEIYFRIVKIGSLPYIEFDAVPDKGDVTIFSDEASK